MCGVPHHSVNSYIERLTNKGYKVAIVEQLEEPGGKKIVQRDVIKIVTPGTNIDENYLDDKNNNYIGAIEKYEMGYLLTYIDLSTGDASIISFLYILNLFIMKFKNFQLKKLL